MIQPKPCDASGCRSKAEFNTHCGAFVCDCGKHVGLTKCFCGWSESGGDGRTELILDGETIEEDSW